MILPLNGEEHALARSCYAAEMGNRVSITGFSHVGIRVHDLALTRAFYELLGFEFLVGPVGPEPVAIMKHPAGVEINLILNAADESQTNMLMDVPTKHAGYTHMALHVDSIEETRAALEGAGCRITEVMNMPGMVAMFVRDPDGNVVEFDEAKAPVEERVKEL